MEQIERIDTKYLYWFFMDGFLRSRASMGFQSGEHCMDEYVNVYISSLLVKICAGSGFNQQSIGYYFGDVGELEELDDERTKYEAYRALGDYLLINLGLFDEVDLPRKFPRTKCQYIGDGQRFYGRASVVAENHLFLGKSKREVFGPLFARMSDGFPKHVDLLRRMRADYLDGLHEKIDIGEIGLSEESKKQLLVGLCDEYFDLRDQEGVEERLRSLELAIKGLAPDFEL